MMTDEGMEPRVDARDEQVSHTVGSAGWMFGDSFVRQVLRWSIVLAVVGGVAGWLLTADSGFAIGLWLGAAVDIATFRYVALHGYQRLESEGFTGVSVGLLLLRFASKGVLLLIAAVLAPGAAFWGVFAGVLIVEFMLVVVGLVRSTTDVFHSDSKPGQGVQG